jgi:DNA-binding Lrp family transcriptional regulator
VKRVLAEIGGFTPVPDIVVEAVGYVGALVYGRVWRYTQKSGACYASHETIADELQMSRKTVLRWIHVLCDAGYLKDMTPELSNRAHTYRVTNMVRIQIRVEAVPESPTTETQSPTTGTESPTTGTESLPKRQSKRQVKRQSKRADHAPVRGTGVPPEPPAADDQAEKEPDLPPPKKKHTQPEAIKVFRHNAHRFPAKAWWPHIDATVGEDEASLQFWGQVVFAWVGLGWNPTNVKGMLECYTAGHLPGASRRTTEETPGQIAARIARDLEKEEQYGYTS